MTLLLMMLAFLSIIGFSESSRERPTACPPPVAAPPAAPPVAGDAACFESAQFCALKEGPRRPQ